ncbi:MAG: hypothetical protein H7Z73_10475 [Candidatus Saccharibacteria bacterium]|nr:hypothetical protein [Moraxellaceae bacterium]
MKQFQLNKNVFKSISAVLIMTFSYTADAKTFTTTDGFSIEIPSDWVQIPPDVTKQYADAINTASPNTKPMYPNYVFQKNTPENSNWFTYPYIIINVKRTGKLTETQMKSFGITPTNTRQIKDQVPNFLTNLEISQPQYDPDARIIWLKVGMEVPDIGRISGLTSVIPTEYGVVQIQGYTKEADYINYLPTFQKVTESFHASEVVRYQNENSKLQSHISP